MNPICEVCSDICMKASTSKIWSFVFGAFSYAAFQANTLQYIIELSRPIVPVQVYFSIITIYTIFSMMYSLLIFNTKKVLKSTLNTSKQFSSYVNNLIYGEIISNNSLSSNPSHTIYSDTTKNPAIHVAQGTMKRPTPRKDLTSEFIASKLCELNKLNTDDDVTKID